MIEAVNLTKRYGKKTAVDNISFTVEPGTVTGFLGPNGSGKSTTMRMIMGLDKPTSGKVTINGRPYRQLSAPLCEVGALLDAKGLHGSRSARSHLRQLAASNGIPAKRVDEVLDITGLTSVAKKRVKGFSLGMGQRLGIAAALLGDPEYLILDEPVNGLDPEGIRWVRGLLRGLAAEGRTVFVSSHILAEMAQTADNLVVIGRGKLVADTSVAEFISSNSAVTTLVRTADEAALERLATSLGEVRRGVDGAQRALLEVPNTSSDEVGRIAFEAGIQLAELAERHASLEDAYMHSTEGHAEYTAPEERRA